jgi:Predicted metal binding domain
MSVQYADLDVSRTKFDREIAEFRSLGDLYLKRGWLLVRAQFPRVLVLLAAPQVKPPAIVMGVSFDYTNYDAAPPSVRLVQPFSEEPYKFSELPTPLMRALPDQQIALPGIVEGGPQLNIQQQQPLMQAHAPDEIPFLCLAGVREYHEHPAHSGDLWELHRSNGAGRLVRLLEVISRYGIEPITGLGVQLVPKVGFNFGPAPA